MSFGCHLIYLQHVCSSRTYYIRHIAQYTYWFVDGWMGLYVQHLNSRQKYFFLHVRAIDTGYMVETM